MVFHSCKRHTSFKDWTRILFWQSLYPLLTPRLAANIRVDKNIVNTGKVPSSIRDIFIIDNKKEIRLIFSYPPTTGSNTEEILRVIDAMKTTDKLGYVLPVIAILSIIQAVIF